MGNISNTQATNSETTSLNLKPIIDEYIEEIQQIKNICTTCSKDWMQKAITSSLGYSELIVAESGDKTELEIILKNIQDDEIKKKIRQFVMENM